MNDRTPPHDAPAEQAILGAIMFDPKAHTEALHIIQGPDFYRPAHEQIWEAAKRIRHNGQPVDANTVAAELTRTKELPRIGGHPYLAELLATVIVTTNIAYHCTIVKDHALNRRLIEETTRNLQDAWESTDPIEAKIARAEERLRKVPTAEPDNLGTLMSFDEFCDQPLPQEEWVVPGLLGRGDRLMLTGLEGLGKSVLMRQFAVSCAAGVHPFTYKPMPAQTVLFVDAENPNRIMVHSFGELRSAMRAKRGPVDDKRLWIERVPAGLNLGDAKDHLWLQRIVSLVNPDLLCIGPAYKLYRGNARDKEEDLARQVTSALDSIRESVGCALIVEAHAGHGDSSAKVRDVRPFGSSLWLRWPEFGYGIRPADGFTKDNRLVDFVPWRGAREERSWPDQLARGTGFLPWVDASYT